METSYPPGWQDECFQSLTQPRLVHGMEWWLWAINGFLCIMLLFVAIHSLSVVPLIIAAILHWPGNMILRATGKHDPNWTSVYYKSLARPLIRAPHGHAHD
jgi:type IV secretory pathway VirB3-like protein